jgi:hypothetical protein
VRESSLGFFLDNMKGFNIGIAVGMFLLLILAVVAVNNNDRVPEVADMEVHNVQFADGTCYVSVTNHGEDTKNAQMRIAARDSKEIDWIIGRRDNITIPSKERVTITANCKTPPDNSDHLWVRKVRY